MRTFRAEHQPDRSHALGGDDAGPSSPMSNSPSREALPAIKAVYRPDARMAGSAAPAVVPQHADYRRNQDEAFLQRWKQQKPTAPLVLPPIGSAAEPGQSAAAPGVCGALQGQMAASEPLFYRRFMASLVKLDRDRYGCIDPEAVARLVRLARLTIDADFP